MATKIRLKRVGRRNRPFYRVVVMDSRNRRDGAAIEEVGWYNPISKDAGDNYSLKEDRILHWLKTGAQPTEIAHHLFKRAGIAYRWHLMKQGLDEKALEKEMQKWIMGKEAAKQTKADKKVKKVEKVEEPVPVEETVVAAVETPVAETPKVPATEPEEAVVVEAKPEVTEEVVEEVAPVEETVEAAVETPVAETPEVPATEPEEAVVEEAVKQKKTDKKVKKTEKVEEPVPVEEVVEAKPEVTEEVVEEKAEKASEDESSKKEDK